MNNGMKKPDRFWDRCAKLYDRLVQKDEDYTNAITRFGKYLKPEDIVLDYACGTGIVGFKIAADVREVQGIDTSGKMIELANKRSRQSEVANVHFARKSIYDEQLGPETFDVIVAFNILHLVEDAQNDVRRATQLLKPGGLLVSTTPCLGESGVVLRTLVPVAAKLFFLSYLRKLKFPELEDLMRDAGLEILESSGKISSWFIVARKQSSARAL